jgi:uncharacterized protein (TIGR03067 family)
VLAVAAVATAVGVWYLVARGPRDDLGRFQGEWQVAVPAMGRDNRPAARIVPGVSVRVTGDRWSYTADGRPAQRYAMTLRPDADPKEIDLVMLGPDDRPTATVIRGVYLIGSDRAKVAHAPKDEPRPTTTDETDPTFSGGVWLLERMP